MKQLMGPAVLGIMMVAAVATVSVFTGTGVSAQAPGVTKAVAVVIPKSGSEVGGTMTFVQDKDGVRITGHITGLNPGQEHGFHVHQFGDATGEDGAAMGGHFNPHGTAHAGPDADERHVGDLGNLKANDKGEAHYERIDKHLSLDLANPNCVIGRGLVIHAGTDDMTTQPTGNAGGRIGVAVIGIANPEAK